MKKPFELAKFHEERGKVNCECWHCEQQRGVGREIRKKEEARKWEKSERSMKEVDCDNCGRSVSYNSWDDMLGICKKCVGE